MVIAWLLIATPAQNSRLREVWVPSSLTYRGRKGKISENPAADTSWPKKAM